MGDPTIQKSLTKEPEWQFGVWCETPNGLGEIYRTQSTYQWLLEDAVEIFSGKWQGCPPDAEPRLYAAVQVTYRKKKRYNKDIRSLLMSDVNRQLNKGESDE